MRQTIIDKSIELGLIDKTDIPKISIFVDELDKSYLREVYQLRLEMNINKNNQEGIEFCNEYLHNIEQCKGEKLISILMRIDSIKKVSFFSDISLSVIWGISR
jgi:hypothetical protein